MSAIPVIVKVVLGVQERLGNENAPVIGAMVRHQAAIVWVLWGIMAVGIVVAIPAMIVNGFFGTGPQQAVQHTIAAIAEGPNLGRLSARPDMSVADMVKQSTIKLDTRYARSAIAGGGVFDYAIPNTGMVSPCALLFHHDIQQRPDARPLADRGHVAAQSLARGTRCGRCCSASAVDQRWLARGS
jgi:hypothetical protein